MVVTPFVCLGKVNSTAFQKAKALIGASSASSFARVKALFATDRLREGARHSGTEQ